MRIHFFLIISLVIALGCDDGEECDLGVRGSSIKCKIDQITFSSGDQSWNIDFVYNEAGQLSSVLRDGVEFHAYEYKDDRLSKVVEKAEDQPVFIHEYEYTSGKEIIIQETVDTGKKLRITKFRDLCGQVTQVEVHDLETDQLISTTKNTWNKGNIMTAIWSNGSSSCISEMIYDNRPNPFSELNGHLGSTVNNVIRTDFGCFVTPEIRNIEYYSNGYPKLIEPHYLSSVLGTAKAEINYRDCE